MPDHEDRHGGLRITLAPRGTRVAEIVDVNTTRLASVALACAFALVAHDARAEGKPWTLGEALSRAMSRAPAIMAAKAARATADEKTSLSRAAYYPTLTAQLAGNASTVRDTQAAPPPSDQVFVYQNSQLSASGGVSLRWTLWDFGRTSNAARAADEGLRAAEAHEAASMAATIADVTTTYLNYVYRRRFVDLTKATVANRERLATIAKALAKSGLQPPIEELRALQRLESSRRDAAVAEVSAADSRAELAVLLGVDASTIGEGKVPSLEVDANAARAEVDAAKGPLPSAARAVADARAAEAEATSSRYFPTIALHGDATYRFAYVDRNDAVLTARTAHGSLVFSVPIFDMAIPSATGAARAEAKHADALAEKAVLDAKREASVAASAVRTVGEQLTHAKKAADLAASVYAVVQARYVQGLSTPVELYDAESADIAARTEKLRAELTETLAKARLLVATGRARILTETDKS
jgi:outer membrane protein TolC